MFVPFSTPWSISYFRVQIIQLLDLREEIFLQYIFKSLKICSLKIDFQAETEQPLSGTEDYSVT